MQNTDYCEIILNSLDRCGIHTAFGVPGGSLALLHSRLCKDERFRVILGQHETGAAYMAMGYNMLQKSNDWALCFATSGPGATNMLTGIAVAFEENVPLLAISGNCATALFGKGGLQDSSSAGINFQAMIKGVTAASLQATETDSPERQIEYLWETALKTRKPVHLDLPIDISKKVLAQSHYERMVNHEAVIR